MTEGFSWDPILIYYGFTFTLVAIVHCSLVFRWSLLGSVFCSPVRRTSVDRISALTASCTSHARAETRRTRAYCINVCIKSFRRAIKPESDNIVNSNARVRNKVVQVRWCRSCTYPSCRNAAWYLSSFEVARINLKKMIYTTLYFHGIPVPSRMNFEQTIDEPARWASYRKSAKNIYMQKRTHIAKVFIIEPQSWYWQQEFVLWSSLLHTRLSVFSGDSSSRHVTSSSSSSSNIVP